MFQPALSKVFRRLTLLALLLAGLAATGVSPAPTAASSCRQLCFNHCIDDYWNCEGTPEQCCAAGNACVISCGSSCPLLCPE